MIYQRAKKRPDTTALGTKHDVYAEGYEWASHSMFPVPASEIDSRVLIGGSECAQPYSASLLNISAMSYGALSGRAGATCAEETGKRPTEESSKRVRKGQR